MNDIKEQLTNVKDNGLSKLHGRTILTTYLTLGVAFVCMLGLNIYAYFTLFEMSEKNTVLMNSTVNIKLRIMNANLFFREIMSGYNDRDMNVVWTLIKDAGSLSQSISNADIEKGLDNKITNYKDLLLKCYLTKDQKKTSSSADLFNEYDNAFKEIISQIDGIEYKVKQLTVKKMLTFKLLYVAFLVNFLLLFWFTLFTFQRYVNRRKAAEKELRDIQNDLNILFNSMDAILFSVDSSGAITKWNTAAEKYFNMSSDQVLDKKAWLIIPFLMEYKLKLETVALSKKPKELYKEKVMVDNKEKTFNIIINPLARGNNGIVIRLEDVTERELKDEQLRQSQKMEVVENLIGGLAHDFNNVLGAITGTISMMKFSLEGKSANTDDIKNNMDLIESSTERAVVMVQQLLSISTKHELALVPVDVNSSVMHVLKICQNTFDKRIELVAELYDVKAMVNADPAQIEQILLNICDNALQAMTVMRPEGEQWGGTLSISVDKVFADKNYRSRHPQAVESSYWVINVADSGVGMDKGVVSKIFDPFFTTKDKEHGTGLGLTLVNDIIKKHNGFIEVEAELGKGCTFSIFLPELVVKAQVHQMQLPATDEAEAAETAEGIEGAPAQVAGGVPVPVPPKPEVKDASQVEQIPTGTGLLLVADDEAIMRKTAGNILEKLGYETVFAEDGQMTVDVFREKHQEIKAVLLDMSMPKMSGRDAYVEMKKIHPGLKVLLVSGFRKDERIQEVLDMGVNGFVQKPYSMITLAQEIKRVISAD
ncbi:MAG: hypothetical protein A2017_01175 [Lentisphaerae bacterium GWF2_44_16]|nr:MAG: hypothetical protein A2017_01175 [Lentisphaerae bacterium GWF2_44_16]